MGVNEVARVKVADVLARLRRLTLTKLRRQCKHMCERRVLKSHLARSSKRWARN